jgi:hypothetical protein
LGFGPNPQHIKTKYPVGSLISLTNKKVSKEAFHKSLESVGKRAESALERPLNLAYDNK